MESEYLQDPFAEAEAPESTDTQVVTRNRRSAKITFSQAKQLHKRAVNAAARMEAVREDLQAYANSFGSESENPIAILLWQATGEAADAVEAASYAAGTSGRVQDALGELYS